MPSYPHKCNYCGLELDLFRPIGARNTPTYCPNCKTLMVRTFEGCGQNIIGTRDNFGVMKSFTDSNTGKEISTWKEWERAGYKNAEESPNLKPKVKEMIKEKKDKIKSQRKERFSI